MNTMEPGPTVRRRQLGRQLRELREAARVTMAEAGERSGLSRATISRIESAKQAILPKNVQLLCQTYGVGAPLIDHLVRLAAESESRGWLLAYNDTTPDWFSRYVAEESEASQVWAFELAFVPGLLQTADYCRAVIKANSPDADDEAVGRMVEFRLQRQQLLDDSRVRYHAIVWEAALRQLVGGAETMRAQVEHLRAMAERPNVTIQILPFEAGAHSAMVSAFVMLHFPAGAQPTIFVEIDSGAIYPDRPTDFERYAWVWSELQRLAAGPKETDGRLAAALSHLIGS